MAFLENLSCVNSTYKTNVSVAWLLLHPYLFSGKHQGCLCLGSNHRGYDHHDVPGSLWYIPFTDVVLQFERHHSLSLRQVPFPLDLGGQNHCANNFLYLLLGLIDLQCLFADSLLLE